MSKPVHPIRRMRFALERAGAAMPFDPTDVEPVISRHVKPLLDALVEDHGHFCHCDLNDPNVKQTRCRLIASWRAKL